MRGKPEAKIQLPGAGKAYTFAHLSDPHLTSLQHVKWHQLRNKRVLGYLSWVRKRRQEHQREMLDLLLEDLLSHDPDHLVITGDLTHIGLPDEFRQARRWLESLGQGPDGLTVVPGNHDTCVTAPWADTFAHWQPYMMSDDKTTSMSPGSLNPGFPLLRQRGPVAFIGLSSACPTPPFMATGSLGNDQLTRLDTLLAKLPKNRWFRVILIHHPVIAGTEKWRKRLTDSPALLEILHHRGAELVLHGHTHQWRQQSAEASDSRIPVFSVPSASATGSHGESACYALFSVSRQDEQWQLDVSARTYEPAVRKFTQGPQVRLTV